MAGEGKALYTEYMSVVDAINAYRQKAGQSALPATYWTSPQVAVGAQMTWSQVEKLDTAITEAQTYHKTGCSSYNSPVGGYNCYDCSSNCGGNNSYDSGYLSSQCSGYDSKAYSNYDSYNSNHNGGYNSSHRGGNHSKEYGGN